MTTRRWVARGRGPIEKIVRLAGGDADAIADGRVFVGRARAEAGMVIDAGTEVVVHSRSSPGDGEIAILLRRAELVAVAKPAGIPTIPDHGGRAHSLLAATARATGIDASALHPTSRLDRDVSGVVVFALTVAGREALRRAREEGRYERRYVAIAVAGPSAPEGEWSAPIGRGKNPRLRAIAGADARPAVTRYRTVAVVSTAALLAVEPVTGRTHQIRVHASAAKLPLLGDRDYGGPTRLTLPGGRSLSLKRVYLHCGRVAIDVADERVTIEAPLPPAFNDVWLSLGGRADDLARALHPSP